MEFSSDLEKNIAQEIIEKDNQFSLMAIRCYLAYNTISKRK